MFLDSPVLDLARVVESTGAMPVPRSWLSSLLLFALTVGLAALFADFG